MGKTKTAVISEVPGEVLTGKAAYEAKKKAQEVKKGTQDKRSKKQVVGVGLKGGERIKVIGADEPIPQTSEEEKDEEIKKEIKPKVRSKKYISSLSKVDKTKLYSIKEAIKLVKETSYSRFDGSVEMHLKVKNDKLNTNVELPYSTGKSKVIEVADDKTLKKLEKGQTDFDLLLATADMMPKLVPFAKLLGPKGLMPNPKNGTIIKDKKDAKKFSGNSVNLKTERKAPIVHIVVGKVGQKEKELEENIEAIFKAMGNKQVIKATLASTMGPGVKMVV